MDFVTPTPGQVDTRVLSRLSMLKLARWMVSPDQHALDDEMAALFGTGDVSHLALGLRHVLLEETKVSDATLLNYFPSRVDHLVHRATVMLYNFDNRETVPRQFYGWIERMVQATVVEVADPDDYDHEVGSYEIYRRSRVAGVVVGAFAKHIYHRGMDSTYACWYIMSSIDWKKAGIRADCKSPDYPLAPAHWAANFFLECIRQSERDEQGHERWGEPTMYLKAGNKLNDLALEELQRIETMQMHNCVREEIDDNMTQNAAAWLTKIVRGNLMTPTRGVRAPVKLMHKGIHKTARCGRREAREICMRLTFGEGKVVAG